MSRITYSKAGSNPFGDDEEDDWGFGPRGTAGQTGRDPFLEEDRPMTATERLQMQKERSIQNTMASTQRALAGIYDAEQTGIATAEELVRQGEQLDNIETKTHEIQQDMKQTQKSLNGIKNVFGSIKNWWSSGKKEEPREQFKPPPRESQLRTTLDQQSDQPGEHPALRMRSDDGRGFYDDHNNDYSASARYSASSSGQNKKSAMAEYDQQFEDQLGMMSDGLSRLKNLGLGLDSEIAAQNQQLDRIQGKVERADVTIQDQNRQMRGILGKKK